MFKQTTLLLSIMVGSCLVGRADELADLQEQRIETLQQAVGLIDAQYRAGEGAIEQLLDAHAALLDTQLDAASTPAQRIKVLTQQLKLSATAEEVADTKVRAGQAKQSDFLLAKAARLRVDALLLKEKKHGVASSSSHGRIELGQEDRGEAARDTPSSKNLLVGEWVGTADGDNKLRLTFNSNGTFELVNVDPAKPQRVKVRAAGTYKADLSASPAHLDLDANIYKPNREEPLKHKFETIIEMVDANRLRMSDLESTSRPKTFGKRSVVLRRQGVTEE